MFRMSEHRRNRLKIAIYILKCNKHLLYNICIKYIYYYVKNYKKVLFFINPKS